MKHTNVRKKLSFEQKMLLFPRHEILKEHNCESYFENSEKNLEENIKEKKP
jgi:hypothetical protein